MRCRAIALLFMVCLFSCKRLKYDKAAIKLNDSAVAIQMNFGNPEHKKSLNDAIALLNRAIDIDSTYVIAYWNKFNCLVQLKHFKDAIATGQKMIKLSPYNSGYVVAVGEAYERMGDTIASKKKYDEALLLYDTALNKTIKGSKNYKNIQFSKVLDLILLKQKQKANAILKQLIDTETNEYSGLTQEYIDAMKTSREEILYGKETESSTMDGKTTTITTINGKSDTVITKAK